MYPNVLEKYRIKKKLSCGQLADMMGKTGGWYSRIRAGSQPLKSQYIPQMAEIFGIKPEKLASEYFSGE
jgi:transcriptional regulator with XRE-family HTH domain